jgi:hypothetical protein
MYFPNLIDTSTKNYIYTNLQNCHLTKVSTYCVIFNISVLVVFLTVTSIILYICYKQKIPESEKIKRLQQDKEYVLSKIKDFKTELKVNQETQFTGITNLPFMDMSSKT